MPSIKIQISPASGAAIPPDAGFSFVDAVYTRLLDSEATPPATPGAIQEATRATLDGTMHASFDLADVAPSTLIGLNFLSASGLVKLQKSMTPDPTGAGIAGLVLNEADIEAITSDGSTSVSQSPDATPPSPPSSSSATGATPDDATDLGPVLDSWGFTDGSESTVPSLPEFDVSGETNDLYVFNSPEHFGAGEGLQPLVDLWAKKGLVSGGAFVEDSDHHGFPLALDAWKFFTPDRANPSKPFGDDFPVGTRAHWHWIVPNAHRDDANNFWTPDSLKAAVRAGKAVTLSVGDIVMLGGDLVGEFADFANAASANWRPGPVNAAKGLALSEPFAMTSARLLQFPRTGLAQKDDVKLLRRNMSDYAGLKAEIASSSDAVWYAVNAVIDFLFKARGPSGCSELLVLSRMMRKEIVTLNLLTSIAPWITDLDVFNLTQTINATGLGDTTKFQFNSDLFQIVVSNGQYAELAMNNAVHFSPDNWTKFENTHTQALQQVEAQVPNNLVTIEYGPIPADALALSAYSMHFLSDAFSSGHMRTPRKALGVSGSLLAGVMHDFDNQMGLTVENGFSQRWRAFGDGYLNNLTPAQRQVLAPLSQVIDARPEANREKVIAAMGSALLQLHYQAQSHFGDTVNAADFQAVLTALRGSSRLLYDDVVFPATPGDPAAGRDVWIAMDIPAKITYMRRHQPVPLTDGGNWRAGSVNHFPLVEVDDAGNPVVSALQGYRWGTHSVTALGIDRILIFNGERDFEVKMTTYLLLAENTPDGALAWLAAREIWLPLALKTWQEEHAI